MIKDYIIAGLLIYILSTFDGWAMSGVPKFLVCLVLTILVGTLFYEAETLLKDLLGGY